MKKTITFDDGSVLVGSGSTFTITQENSYTGDIQDMPSIYIWVKNYWDTLDGNEEDLPNLFDIVLYKGDERYQLTVLLLEPCKIHNVKCKVVSVDAIQKASAVATMADGSKEYDFGNTVNFNSYNCVKIDCLNPITGIEASNCPNLTEVNLKGTLSGNIYIRNNPKLTKITCDQPFSANNKNVLQLSNNPLLTQIPGFTNNYQTQLTGTFNGDKSLDIDISNIILKGNCSNAFNYTGITNAQIKDASDSLFRAFYNCLKLKSVTCVNSLSMCTDFTQLFEYNSNLTDCDLSGLSLRKAKILSGMFDSCSSLKSTKLNFSNLSESLTDISFIFSGSAIADDIILPDAASNLQYIQRMCSAYTKRVKLPNSLAKLNATNTKDPFVNATSLEYLEWDNFGMTPNLTTFSFTSNTKLGTGSDENLQAFKNLFNNAYDRKSNNLSVCTVSLAAEQKALLTADEITAFENKGYKIA